MAQKKYKHLTYEERKLLGNLRIRKKSVKEIAEILGRATSTIYRELRRPSHNGVYDSQRSHAHAMRQRRIPRKPLKIVDDLEIFVKECLEKLWSPEQIANRAKRERRYRVCFRSIYTWLYKDKLAGGTFCKYLRINRRKRYTVRCRSKIPGRVGIEERPKVVNSRRRYGDWEGDTAQGKVNTGCLVTIVERKSRFTLLALLDGKYSETLNREVIRRFSEYPSLPRATLTLDNGTEFTGHRQLHEALGLDIYFANPQASYQRGLNENTNGLIRQYLAKGIDFRTVTKEQIAFIQNAINNRPRKALGYRTPTEVMAEKGFLSSFHL